MPTLTADEWLSLSQAAARLGCSAGTMRDRVDAGKVLGIRSPLGRLVSAADVERLVAERREQTAPETKPAAPAEATA
jgi:hypothetical protein